MRRNRHYLSKKTFAAVILTVSLLTVGRIPGQASPTSPTVLADSPNPDDEQVQPGPIDTVTTLGSPEQTGGSGKLVEATKDSKTGKVDSGDKKDKKAKPTKRASKHLEVRPRLLERDDVLAGSASTGAGVARSLQQLPRPIPGPDRPATLATTQLARAAAAPAAATVVTSIAMKILVISADGNESDLKEIQQTLRQLGLPFETMIATTAPDLVPSKLSDGGGIGYYQAVILTTGGLAYYDAATNSWPSAFTNAEWQTLWAYEAAFKIRQITAFTYPGGYPDTYGLSYVSYQDTLTSPLTATLTPAGAAIFGDLNSATPITLKGAWVYFGTVLDPAVTTPLITTAQGYPVASITTYPDGRQNLAVTVANNTELVHSLLLSYGLVNWATKGLFLGERHVNTSYQIDDLYIADDIWDPAALSDQTGLSYRNDAADIAALVAWQNGTRAAPSTSAFRLEWAFNGEGASGIYSPDDLTPAIKANQAQFNFINHTFTHQNLDAPTTAALVTTELSQNHNFRATVPFTNYSRDSMVQPDISGLTNPAFFQGAISFGIRYVISDTSQPGWNNPTPNAGFRNPAYPSILIIPRRPSNLFYNLSTPTEWVSEFNYFYGPGGIWAFFAQPLSYQEILNVESDWLVKYLLKWDIDPLMFHIPNVRAYDGSHSLLGDLIDATFAKYRAMVKLPIRNQTQHAVGLKMASRMSFDLSGTTASLKPCVSVTVTALQATKVPITGVAFGTSREVYGGQNISYVSLAAGQSAVIPTTVC